VSISGTISPTASGTATTVSLSGASSATTTTDSSGNYKFSGLSSGTYKVAPSKSQFIFSPASQIMTVVETDIVEVNFRGLKTGSTGGLTISGRIGPAPNGSSATVTLSGATSATTTTDSQGNFTFSGLSGGDYALTPSKNGFTFSPASQHLTLSALDLEGVSFSASQIGSTTMYSITGMISPAANSSGATVSLSGATSATTTADSSGHFSFSSLPSGAYTVTPSKSQFTFSPGSQSMNVGNSDVVGVNFSVSQSHPTGGLTISGRIGPGANGSATTVRLSGAASDVITTDSAGNFTFLGLSAGLYTVTPSKDGFTFSPPNLRAALSATSITGIDFTASRVISTLTYSITGTITPSTNGSGTMVTLNGAASATTTTDSSGNYKFSGLSGGTYTVTPNKSAFQFNPSSQSTTIGAANVTGLNFSASQTATSAVNIYPGQDIPSVVSASPAGTTFFIYPGTYRLTRSILPKNGDSFIGQTACAPPATACPAVISGSRVIGPLASFDGRNYKVANQNQQGERGLTAYCDSGWERCTYPEDLFFDGVPYQHLSSSTLPAIGPGQWWFDYTNHIIYLHDNPSGHTVETSVLQNGFGGIANNVTIQYLTVKEFADMYPDGTIGVYQGPNPQTQGANWTVQDCEILLNHGFGVRVGYGIHILHNYIHDNGQTGVGGGIGIKSSPWTQSINSGILIQDNLITHNDYAHFSPDFGSGGIKIGATSGVIIRGNTIQHNEGSGVHFDDYSTNELLEDNIIADNSDLDGVNQEKGYGASTFRNNVILRNGAQVNDNYFSFQIHVSTSAGVESYCNTLEVPSGKGIGAWGIGSDNRGYSPFPPYQYLTTTGSSFHHNTVIWDSAATGITGFHLGDPINQPEFFANNRPPDHNQYHLSNMSAVLFKYDNNDSGKNASKTFASYQAAGADVHGTVDTNNASGFPKVAIMSPADQSSFSKSVRVTAAASDKSGISKLEFYVDWALQATVTAAPYTVTLTPNSSGQHTLAAMAYSNAGIRACYAVTLNQQ
jgi:hypothetical protein